MDQGLNTVRTQRLHLRKLRYEDDTLIQALNSNPEVMQFIGPTQDSLEKASVYVRQRVDEYHSRDGLGIFVAELADTASHPGGIKIKKIGWFCLKNLDDTAEIEVGYRLLPAYWNKGYATEGASALVDHGFRRLGLIEIVGVCMPSNLASRRVLEKAGLEYAGLGQYYGHELSYFRLPAEKYFRGVRE